MSLVVLLTLHLFAGLTSVISIEISIDLTEQPLYADWNNLNDSSACSFLKLICVSWRKWLNKIMSMVLTVWNDKYQSNSNKKIM